MEQVTLPYLRETILFLVMAGVLIPLLARLRINQTLGFLVFGCLVGPFGAGAMVAEHPWLAQFSFSRLEGVRALADLGVIFLMFTIGLELSASRLRSMWRWVFVSGSMQVALTASFIGLFAYVFGSNFNEALVIGVALSFSSTAVVMQLLGSKREIGTTKGRSVFSILLLQDLVVVPVIIFVSLIGSSNDGELLTAVGAAMVKGFFSIGLIYLIGRRVTRPIFHYLGVRGHQDTFMALILLSTLGMAALTRMAGLSMAAGAFLAGLLLAETEYRHEVEITIEPFKGLLLGLFFMSVGMSIDTSILMRDPVWLPIFVLLIILTKAVIAALSLRFSGLSPGQSIEGGFLLSQGGEFAFILVSAALSSGIMSDSAGQFIMLAVGLSMIVTPAFWWIGSKAGYLVDRRYVHKHKSADELAAEKLSGHVIIAGFGRVGQLVASVLDEHKVSYLAVENNPKEVRKWFGKQNVVLGDASHPELLHKIGVDKAVAVILTMDDAASAVRAANIIRKEFPKMPLVARARDERHAVKLRDAGVNLTVPETLESSLQLSSFALSSLGVPDETVSRLLDFCREKRIATFRK